MPKRQTKVLPARKTAASGDDSLLIRSAESLGRVIGSLQRQVRGTTKRMSTAAVDAMDALPEVPKVPDVGTPVGRGSRKPPAARKTTAARKRSAARKSTGTGQGVAGARKKASTTRGARTAARRKTSGRSR
jgi:hypothetical protein